MARTASNTKQRKPASHRVPTVSVKARVLCALFTIERLKRIKVVNRSTIHAQIKKDAASRSYSVPSRYIINKAMESLVNGHLLTKGNRTLAFANGVKAGIEVKLQLHAESGRSTKNASEEERAAARYISSRESDSESDDADSTSSETDESEATPSVSVASNTSTQQKPRVDRSTQRHAHFTRSISRSSKRPSSQLDGSSSLSSIETSSSEAEILTSTDQRGDGEGILALRKPQNQITPRKKSKAKIVIEAVDKGKGKASSRHPPPPKRQRSSSPIPTFRKGKVVRFNSDTDTDSTSSEEDGSGSDARTSESRSTSKRSLLSRFDKTSRSGSSSQQPTKSRSSSTTLSPKKKSTPMPTSPLHQLKRSDLITRVKEMQKEHKEVMDELKEKVDDIYTVSKSLLAVRANELKYKERLAKYEEVASDSDDDDDEDLGATSEEGVYGDTEAEDMGGMGDFDFDDFTAEESDAGVQSAVVQVDRSSSPIAGPSSHLDKYRLTTSPSIEQGSRRDGEGSEMRRAIQHQDQASLAGNGASSSALFTADYPQLSFDGDAQLLQGTAGPSSSSAGASETVIVTSGIWSPNKNLSSSFIRHPPSPPSSRVDQAGPSSSSPLSSKQPAFDPDQDRNEDPHDDHRSHYSLLLSPNLSSSPLKQAPPSSIGSRQVSKDSEQLRLMEQEGEASNEKMAQLVESKNSVQRQLDEMSRQFSALSSAHQLLLSLHSPSSVDQIIETEPLTRSDAAINTSPVSCFTISTNMKVSLSDLSTNTEVDNLPAQHDELRLAHDTLVADLARVEAMLSSKDMELSTYRIQASVHSARIATAESSVELLGLQLTKSAQELLQARSTTLQMNQELDRTRQKYDQLVVEKAAVDARVILFESNISTAVAELEVIESRRVEENAASAIVRADLAAALGREAGLDRRLGAAESRLLGQEAILKKLQDLQEAYDLALDSNQALLQKVNSTTAQLLKSEVSLSNLRESSAGEIVALEQRLIGLESVASEAKVESEVERRKRQEAEARFEHLRDGSLAQYQALFDLASENIQRLRMVTADGSASSATTIDPAAANDVASLIGGVGGREEVEGREVVRDSDVGRGGQEL